MNCTRCRFGGTFSERLQCLLNSICNREWTTVAISQIALSGDNVRYVALMNIYEQHEMTAS